MSDELRDDDGREPVGAEPKPDEHNSQLPQEIVEHVDSPQQSDAAPANDTSREREFSDNHNSDPHDAPQPVNLKSNGAAANGREHVDTSSEEHEQAKASSGHGEVLELTKIDELAGNLTSPPGKSQQSAQSEIDDPFSGELTPEDEIILRSYDETLARGGERFIPKYDSLPSTGEFAHFQPSPSLDLIREVSGDESIYVCLVQWSNTQPKVTYGKRIEYGGRTYYAPQLPAALYDSTVLPSGLRNHGTTKKLFDSIRGLLQTYLMLSEKQSALLTHWCIASWFPDILQFIPRLTITGPKYAADLLLKTLRCVCRRPILLAGVTPAVLKIIPIKELMPTLLIRGTGPSKRTAELLDASDQRGYLLASGGQLRQCYCARCVYLGEEYTPQGVMLDGIHIHVARNSLLPDHPAPSETAIQILQNQLLYYRSFNRELVENSRYNPTGLLPESRAMARQLGAAIVGDAELQRRIPELLLEQNEQGRVDRASGMKGVVLRAVLSYCHEGDRQQVFTREIAAKVNQINIDDGETLQVSNETVGHTLKNLGLYSRRLGSAGRGLVLDKAIRSRAHALSVAYEVLPPAPLCGYCLKLQEPQSEEVMQEVEGMNVIDPPL